MDVLPKRVDVAALARVARECDVVCEPARDRSSLLAAFRLIYTAYRDKHLTRSNRLELRILPHQLLETSTVLLARCNGRPTGTLTLVEDGALGVPMESLYGNEIAKLRGAGMRFAELACMATERRAVSMRLAVLRRLLQAALDEAAARRIERLTICVHPRHRDFYQHRLGFKQFGPVRRCPLVCRQPAVAMHGGLASEARETDSNHRPRAAMTALVHRPQRAERETLWSLLEEASPISWPLERAVAA